jgi:DNA primase
MQISKEEIDAVKRAHDLRTVIESYGIALKKKGGNYVSLCPFHEETTPSFTVNPKTSLYHCFGCNAAGDMIGFVCKTEGIGFREAMERLGNGSRQRSAISRKTMTTAQGVPVNRQRITDNRQRRALPACASG